MVVSCSFAAAADNLLLLFSFYFQPEWLIANNGAIAAGGLAAGIYTTNLPEACHYVAEHSDAEVSFQ